MNKGFTLIELLGVIIIISLLALIMFPNIISSFFDATNKLDEATELLVVEAAKDYYEENKNNIYDLDYCVTILTLQEDGLLSADVKDSDGKLLPSEMLVKIAKKGNSFDVNQKCIVTESEINEAAVSYYNDGNIAIAEGESKCINILALQNAYYLSPNIINEAENFYATDATIKLTRSGETIISNYNEAC